MPHQRILAIVQAGGAGSRMDVLTRERAKPALPFAGIYQLIDFSLSNLAHSGITDVWLSVQFQGSTLEEQVSNGRPWDLDRNRGGLRLLMPQEGTGSTDEEGFATGNADELYRLRDQIRDADPAYVVVMSADHVYQFDFRDAIATHHELGADCTVVTTEVEIGEAGDHAVVEVGDDRRVTGFEYKPDRARDVTVAAEIFVYDPTSWSRRWRSCTASSRADAPEGDTRPRRLRRPSAPPARRAAPRGGPPAGGLLARPRRAAQVRRRPPRPPARRPRRPRRPGLADPDPPAAAGPGPRPRGRGRRRQPAQPGLPHRRAPWSAACSARAWSWSPGRPCATAWCSRTRSCEAGATRRLGGGRPPLHDRERQHGRRRPPTSSATASEIVLVGLVTRCRPARRSSPAPGWSRAAPADRTPFSRCGLP